MLQKLMSLEAFPWARQSMFQTNIPTHGLQQENESKHDKRDWINFALLLAATVCLRVANRGALYFVDGPRIVYSIVTKTFAIQRPGYWAFAHLGGLFSRPDIGLAFWNITFSGLGVAIFYLLCRQKQRGQVICLLAALAYGSVYFVWFAGEIHSSYASQILFPPLSFYCFLRFQRRNELQWAVAWALSSAIGMAIRPSDGIFLLPLNLYLLARYVKPSRIWVIYALVNMFCFLAWYIPTRAASQSMPYYRDTGATIWVSMQTVSPLLVGIDGRSLANISRVIVPLLFAFWTLVPALFSARNTETTTVGLIWVLPGLLFFLLCYVADPTYMVFLSGALFWLASTSFNSRRAMICLSLCAAFNTGIFVFAQPAKTGDTASRLYNFYVVKYCRYGIRHQWSSTVGNGARVPD